MKIFTTQQEHEYYIYSLLKSIHYLLSFGELKQAQSHLDAFNRSEHVDFLSPGLVIFHHFVKAKMEFILYKQSCFHFHLENAQDCLDTLMSFVEGAGVSLKSPKYLMLRIHVAYRLSQEISDTKRRETFAHVARCLAEVGIAKYPKVVAFEDIYIMVAGDKLNPSQFILSNTNPKV